MDDQAATNARLACDGCGAQSVRSLGVAPDPFCHACGDLMRIVNLEPRGLPCEGRPQRRGAANHVKRRP